MSKIKVKVQLDANNAAIVKFKHHPKLPGEEYTAKTKGKPKIHIWKSYEFRYNSYCAAPNLKQAESDKTAAKAFAKAVEKFWAEI